MAMTLIEGIGDEVIEFFIGLIIIVIGAVAWWSTRIADRPLIRTVLVFERRTHSNAINHQNVIDERRNTATTDQRDYVQDLATVPLETASGEHSRQENKPPETRSNLEENTSSDSNSNSIGNGSGDNTEISSTSQHVEEEEQRDILESMDSEDACVLRRRRLDFFQNNRQDTLISSSSSTSNTNIDNNVNNEGTADDDKPTNHENVKTTSTPEINNLEEDIRIKLKYINDDLKLVNGKLKEPLGDFKRRHFEFELANDKLVRLIFNGQVLQRDDLTLQGCGLFDNCVVHCLVHQKKPNANDHTASNSNINSGSSSTTGNNTTNSDRPRMASNTHNQGRDRDLGNLFFAIITFLLGAAWYFRYEYAQLYTVTATVALVGLTGIFTVLLVGMYYPENPAQQVRS